MKAGDNADSYYIIKSGSVSIIGEDNSELREIKEGEDFGEAALFL